MKNFILIITVIIATVFTGCVESHSERAIREEFKLNTKKVFSILTSEKIKEHKNFEFLDISKFLYSAGDSVCTFRFSEYDSEGRIDYYLMYYDYPGKNTLSIEKSFLGDTIVLLIELPNGDPIGFGKLEGYNKAGYKESSEEDYSVYVNYSLVGIKDRFDIKGRLTEKKVRKMNRFLREARYHLYMNYKN